MLILCLGTVRFGVFLGAGLEPLERDTLGAVAHAKSRFLSVGTSDLVYRAGRLAAGELRAH